MALEGGAAKSLVPGETTVSPELVQALVRKRLTPAMRANLGMAGVPAGSVLPPSAGRRSRKAAAKES